MYELKGRCWGQWSCLIGMPTACNTVYFVKDAVVHTKSVWFETHKNSIKKHIMKCSRLNRTHFLKYKKQWVIQRELRCEQKEIMTWVFTDLPLTSHYFVKLLYFCWLKTWMHCTCWLWRPWWTTLRAAGGSSLLSEDKRRSGTITDTSSFYIYNILILI